MKKAAVVLLNMGGPDSQESIKPFLFNLFSDKAIIRLPQPFRFLIAKLISNWRSPKAHEIYAKLGGSSPILKNTQDQAKALEKALNETSCNPLFKTFIAMRYAPPLTSETIREIIDFTPDEIILLPLYPQYSMTTTQSSLKDWQKCAQKSGLNTKTRTILCYPQEHGFIRALAIATRRAYDEAKKFGTPRILFSAHGLPEKIVRAGDPYQAQCALTAEALRQELAIENLDSVLCFQSRVGPMRWIGPSAEAEVRRAGQDKVPVIVTPLAFVSENSETLVEIDIDYRSLALQCGVPFFARVPAVGTAPPFINGLTQLVRDAWTQKKDSFCVTDA